MTPDELRDKLISIADTIENTAEMSCACAQSALESVEEIRQIVKSIPGIEAVQFTINALTVEGGKLVWAQGKEGAVIRNDQHDWCSGVEHTAIYYTLNKAGEVVRHVPITTQ